MQLSVIIPTRNRAHLLKKLLDSLLFQDISQEEFELIIIDNGSTDITKEICEKYKKNFVNFQYLYDDRPGLHTGRNLGFLNSKTEILVYGDDDIIVPVNWLSAILKGFKDPQVVLIGGNDIPDYEQEPPSWVLNLWTTDSDGNRLLLPFSCINMGNKKKYIKANYVFGCNFSVRKEVIRKTKGFHPDGMPKKYIKFRGDGETFVSEYITNNNLKTLFLPEASVRHFVSTSRMTNEYIDGIAFKNGISHRFTELRKNPTFIDAIKTYIKFIISGQDDSFTKGNRFLLKNYIKSRKLRKWVNLDNYIDVSIKDYL